MDLIKIINEAIENMPPDEHRSYVGASGIGSECWRSIWYSFKGVQGIPFTARQRRTFEIGKRLEDMVLDYIELAGFKLIRPAPGSKGIPCEDNEFPIFKGNMDGILFVTANHQVVLELKTAKSSEYKKFVESGVKIWKPTYYAQIQSYMGMKGLKHAVIIVINKDTSEWHAEWVEFDEIFFYELRAKAVMISEMEEAPAKINANPCYWICQSCKYKDLCHKPGATVEQPSP